MKTIRFAAILALLSSQFVDAQDTFNLENVKTIEGAIASSLKTNQTVINWKSAQDPDIKRDAFNSTIQEIAGPILARQWTYPEGVVWPLLDWSKVSTLSDLMNDQRRVLEATHIVAQSDEELAKICVLVEVIIGLGTEAESWYEDWLLSLAKSTNTNLKRLVFLSVSKCGEDILRKTGEMRAIDWNKWEAAFNQSDEFGKALLLNCMTDLASRSEEYTKVASMHIGVFNGTNDDLKAIALYSGSKKLGSAVVAKWQDIADNHTNPKMKALAQELLAR